MALREWNRANLMLFLSCSCVTALHPTSGFAVRFNAWQEAYRPQTDAVSNSVGPTPSGTLSCAVCVVGQLARLELESKVRHTLALAHISQALARARARARALALALRNLATTLTRPSSYTCSL